MTTHGAVNIAAQRPTVRRGSEAVPIVVGLLACVLVFVAQSNYGVGITPDSMQYYSYAQAYALADFRPLNSPFYPMLLAIGHGAFRLPLDLAATCVNAVAFGLTVGLVAWWVRMRGAASSFLTAWAGLLCGTSVLADWAAYALTEPLCVALATLSLLVLDTFGETRRKRLCLAVAAVAACACSLTRPVVGVPLVGTLALCLFYFAPPRGWQRWVVPAAFGCCALVPVGAWLLYWRIAGSVVPMPGFSIDRDWPVFIEHTLRSFFRPIDIELLEDGIRTFADPSDAAWLSVSVRWKAAFLCVLGFLFGALAGLVRGHMPSGVERTFLLIAVFLATYSFTLVLACVVVDTTFEARYLVPMYAPGLVMVTLVLQGLFAKTREALKGSKVFAVLGSCGLLSLVTACQGIKLHHQIAQTYNHTWSHLTQGRGYSAKPWRQSETINFLRESVPPTALIFVSRAYGAVGWALNRHGDERMVLPVPSHFTRPSYMVWFHDLRQPGYMDKGRDLLSWIGTPGLSVLEAFKDGVVFRFDPDAASRNERLKASSLKNAILAAVSDGGRQVYSGQLFDLYQTTSTSRHSPSLDVDADDVDGTADHLIYSVRDCDSDSLPPPGWSVFLHVVPVDLESLPADVRETGRGFENLDYQFNDESRYIYPGCLVMVDLPRYPVKSIRTGLWDGQSENEDWSVEIALGGK